jgi:hypothetical protein
LRMSWLNVDVGWSYSTLCCLGIVDVGVESV